VQPIFIVLPVVGAIAGFFLARRFLQGSNRNTVAIGCGLIVVASSAYTLLTTSPETVTYRLHLGLLMIAAVAIFVRALRTRRS
jgi:uncharacterized membrane protein